MRNFLDYSVTKQEDAVETLFCEKLEKEGIKVPMSEMESKFMIALLFIREENQLDKMYGELRKKCFYLPVLKARIETLGYTVDKRTELMLAIIAGNVGTIVMYVYYLAYRAKQLGVKEITFNLLCEILFPRGFFSKESMEKIWDEQKVSRKTPEERGSDNLLDYSTASLSLLSK